MPLYILDENHNIISVEGDFKKWAEFMEKDFDSTKRVGLDNIGKFRISTVFLGIDMNVIFGLPPCLFETIVFSSEKIKLSQRCATWDEAIIQHNEVLEKVKTWKTNTFTNTNE